MSSDHETGLTINQAASRLGVSENAVRQRIKRGTLSAVKVAGVWRVQLIDQQAGDQSATTTETTSDHQGDNAALVEQLRSENARLWEELESRREETRRLHILAAQQQDSISELAGRVQALSAGPEQPKQPEPEPVDTSHNDAADIWTSQQPETAIDKWWLEMSQEVPEEPQSSDSTSNSPDPHKGSGRPWWAFWRS